MEKIMIAAMLLVPAIAIAHDPVKCSVMTTVIQQKYDLSRDALYQVNQACKTGIQMKSDGIGEERFAVFLKAAVSDNPDMSYSVRRATEESMVAGYDGEATN